MVWGIGSRKRKGAANASTSSTGAIPQPTMPTLGIANFITYRDYTYKRLTLEFLATLETNSTPSDLNDQFSNPNITMTFQMFNQQHSLNLDELNTIFGWPTDTEYGPMGFWVIEDCDADLLWQGISGEESFNSRSSKASWIVSPVLRIVHRLLVMALFQKQEIRAITKDKLRVIWLSLQNPTQYHALNNGAYLLDRFIATASGEVFKSAFLSGGMITIIARALGHVVDVDSDPRGPIDNDIFLDLGAMRSMEFFQGNRAMRPPFKWLVRGKEWMMVPSPHNNFESRDFMLPPNEFSKFKKTKRSTIDEAGPSSAPHRHSTSSVPSSEMQMILERMSSMHVQQKQTTECVLGLRRDMDVLNRVAWRNHLANVYHGLAPGFPNHPMYPPSFGPTPGPFAEPHFSTLYYPYHTPYFPRPEGNDDDDA
ncbi:UDP-3-O-acylglucosamine N-acyltransferase [Bienertia sinuspersici]